jgi:hypothetical protein
MIGKDDPGVDAARCAGTHPTNRVAQYVDLRHQQIRSAVEQVHRKEEDSGRLRRITDLPIGQNQTTFSLEPSRHAQWLLPVGIFVAMQFCIPVQLVGLQLLVPVAVQFVDTGHGPWLTFEAATCFTNFS